jgi:hypothetical protein
MFTSDSQVIESVKDAVNTIIATIFSGDSGTMQEKESRASTVVQVAYEGLRGTVGMMAQSEVDQQERNALSKIQLVVEALPVFEKRLGVTPTVVDVKPTHADCSG